MGVCRLKKIALIVNFNKENALETAKELILNLKGKAELYCPMEDAAFLPDVYGKSDDELFSSCKVVAVLGGDGTIIAAAKRCEAYQNILFGINIGHLGYLSVFESSDIKGAADILLSDDIHFDDRYMLEITHYSQGRAEGTYHALNEAVLSRGDSSRLMDFSVTGNDKTICSYRADGIIIATPTGSTAYSLAAGGPILSPDADVMLITPICPHMLRARSIVIPPKEIVVMANQPSQLSVDGQIFISLENGDKIVIKKSNCHAFLAHRREMSFYDILQEKLK